MVLERESIVEARGLAFQLYLEGETTPSNMGSQSGIDNEVMVFKFSLEMKSMGTELRIL